MKEILNSYILPSGVLFTFIATCINIYFTRQSSKTSKYIDTITAERIKWLSLIRGEISELIAIISETLIYYTEEIDNIESRNPDDNYMSNAQYEYQSHYFDTLTKNSLNFREKIDYEDVIKRLHILKLRFNPVEDIETLDLIQYFINYYTDKYKSKKDIEEANEKINNLVINIQLLLKDEWEKVKKESKGK
ncbi:hypothetical protein [uncultured Chryseobacterium sp.]|uniref:hypothetical protein n=1 Tax=uncultured Chryseobacterium sp. TaxID=259322 RepID=UPI0025D5D2A3|nr:hypothetical protein [uncultured Chryseobacterium sp.]